MKVLFSIHHDLEPNQGAPGVTVELAEAMRRLGHAADIYSWTDLPGHLSDRSRELLFPVFVAHRMRQADRSEACDVIETSTGDAWLYRGTPAPAARPLLVTRSHGLEHVYFEQLRDQARLDQRRLSWLERTYHGRARLWQVARSLRMADLALFANSGDLRFAVAKLGVKPERASVFENGVPQDFLDSSEQGPKPDVGPMVTFVGSYTERKGVRHLVPALDQLLLGHPDLSVSLVGTGVPEESIVTDFTPSVRSRVHTVMRYERRDLVELVRGCTIGLLPSLAEGQSLAVLELMALGLVPVVTPAAAGDVVRDEVNGLVVRPRDSQAIVRAVERLLSAPQQAARLAASARASAADRSWPRVADRLLDLYDQHLSRLRA